VRQRENQPHSAAADADSENVRGQLFRKYAGLFVAVVLVALLSNGLVEIWFQYQSYTSALVRLQREQAQAAGAKIEQFIKEIQNQIGWTTQLPWTPDAALEQRRFDALRLLRQVPAITEIAQLDSTGHEQLRVSRLATDEVGGGTDFSAEPKFTEAIAHKFYFGPVYFRRGSEPYMTLAVAGARRAAGVSVAEVNLRFIWDVVSQIRVGQHGHALVVDANDRLIAYPDLSLVLRNTDLSDLAQVRQARASSGALPTPETREARDMEGRRVLTAYAPVEPLGWLVFVELPLDEAYAPLISSIERSGLVLLAALALALFAGMVLARKMVGPIYALRAGAARIGSGDLGHRISIKTGDELEALAAQFNDMAGRLQESYANLENKVEALRRNEAYLSAGQSIIRTGSWAWNVESGEVYWSQEVFSILGFDSKSYKPTLGASAGLLSDDERQMFHQRLETAVHERSEFSYEYRIVLPDRSEKNVQSVAKPIVNSSGALEYIGILADVTDRRRAEQALRRAQAELARVARVTTVGELGASIAHEINQPLAAIVASGNACRRWLANGRDLTRAKESLDRIISDAHRAGEVIKRVRALTRNKAPEHVRLLVNDIVDDVLTFTQSELHARQILVRKEFCADAPAIMGDKVQLQQVLLNLVMNGIEAMAPVTDRRRELVIRCRPNDDGNLVVDVQDTGIGLDPNDAQRIFDPFYTTKPEGMGMGLSISMSIVEAHGGRLWASPATPYGTVFHFTVPAGSGSPT